MYQKIYTTLILEVDANDNGVAPSKNMTYSIKTGLPAMVAVYNMPWNAPNNLLINQHS